MRSRRPSTTPTCVGSCGLVDQFRGSAQLAIVTHQQQTMEAADVLYGVTMEPGGSSKVVAKRMTNAPVAV